LMVLSSKTVSQYVENLGSIVGSRNVTDDEYACFPYGRADVFDQYRGETPYCVVRPGTIDEVQAVMRSCNEWKMPVYVRSRGTLGLGAIPLKKGVVIDMSRMNRLLKVDEGSLSCILEPAITFGELEKLLDPHGFRMLVYPGVADAFRAWFGFIRHAGRLRAGSKGGVARRRARLHR